jgi:hypothetical protein
LNHAFCLLLWYLAIASWLLFTPLVSGHWIMTSVYSFGIWPLNHDFCLLLWYLRLFQQWLSTISPILMIILKKTTMTSHLQTFNNGQKKIHEMAKRWFTKHFFLIKTTVEQRTLLKPN